MNFVYPNHPKARQLNSPNLFSPHLAEKGNLNETNISKLAKFFLLLRKHKSFREIYVGTKKSRRERKRRDSEDLFSQNKSRLGVRCSNFFFAFIPFERRLRRADDFLFYHEIDFSTSRILFACFELFWVSATSRSSWRISTSLNLICLTSLRDSFEFLRYFRLWSEIGSHPRKLISADPLPTRQSNRKSLLINYFWQLKIGR